MGVRTQSAPLARVRSATGNRRVKRLKGAVQWGGGLWVSERHRNATVAAVQRLTGRQRQILDLLCENMTSRQVGAVLGICARTVDNHCVRICRSLGVGDRFEAVRVWRLSAGEDVTRPPGRN